MFLKTAGDIREVLRTLFNSDFFKAARYARVKTPVELATALQNLTWEYQSVETDMERLWAATGLMGQMLLNPLTVEGWPRGMAWVDGGTLNNRVNFAIAEIDRVSKPGIRAILDRLASEGRPLPPEEFLDRCVEIVAPAPLREATKLGLLHHAHQGGNLDLNDPTTRHRQEARVLRMLQLIVSTREYQLN